METKICKKCGIEKFLDEFHKHPGMINGRINKCKDCLKEFYRKKNKKTVGYRREFNRKRMEDPSRKAYKNMKAKEYYIKNKERKSEYNKKWYTNNKEKYAAKTLLNNRIKSGEIKKKPCQICKATKNVEGHHFDYGKPIDVVWLCRTHHMRVHVWLNINKRILRTMLKKQMS